jgi:DMSO/TMAO reductase YedYZ heme-binding membrane subunit
VRLLALPFLALAAGRWLSYAVLLQFPALDLVSQLCLSVALAALGFGTVMLACAPRRVVAIMRQLHQALFARAPAPSPL